MTHYQLAVVAPSLLKAYLSRSGWEKAEIKNKTLTKYVYKSDHNLSVFVPEDRGSRDYSFLNEKVITIISQVEGRSKEAVLHNVLSLNQDELRFQFEGTSAKSGSLPLGYLISSAKAIQDAIIYAACAEIKPQPFYQRKLKDAIQRSKKARFGQTEYGSFILSIVMPFDPPVRDSQSGEAPDDPFGRRVMTRLVRGVTKAVKVAEDGETIDLENEYKTGLNANISESLADLADDGLGIEVSFSCRWSGSLGVPKDVVTEPIKLDSTTFSNLVSIGKRLRGPSISKDVAIEGFIVALSREDAMDGGDDGDDFLERTVVVRPDASEDLPTKSIRIPLSVVDYNRACDAHRDRKRVYVTGRLEKLRTWQMSTYTDFGIRN